MKKNDMAILLIIVVLVSLAAWFGAGSLIGEPKTNPIQVEQVAPIGASFPAPDGRVFNEKSVDPTVEITDDGSSNAKPFAN